MIDLDKLRSVGSVAFGLEMFVDYQYLMRYFGTGLLVAIGSLGRIEIAMGFVDNQIGLYMSVGSEDFLAVLVGFGRFDLEYSSQKIGLFEKTIESGLAEFAIEIALAEWFAEGLIDSGLFEFVLVAIEWYFGLVGTAMTGVRFEAVVEDYFDPFVPGMTAETAVAGMFVGQGELADFVDLVELIVLGRFVPGRAAMFVAGSVLSDCFGFDWEILEKMRWFVLGFLAAMYSAVLGKSAPAGLVDIVGIGYYQAGQRIEKFVLGLDLGSIDLVTDIGAGSGCPDCFLEAVVT